MDGQDLGYKGSIVDIAMYEEGQRKPISARGIWDLLGEIEKSPHATGWIAYDCPDLNDIRTIARALSLHPMLVEDIVTSHQRPKLERYGSTLFCVMKPAVYDEATEDVLLGETHIVVAGRTVVCIRQRGDRNAPDRRWVDEVNRRFEAQAPMLQSGPEAMLYAVIDYTADGYAPALRGIVDDIDDVERQVFSGDAAAPERIYRLSRELVDLQHAIAPLQSVVKALQSGFEKYAVATQLRAYLADVADHLTRDAELTAELRDMLTRILNVNATLVAQRQNDDMKKISAWAAIIFTPSVIGSIYGMNFSHMPELDTVWGYPFALTLMLASAVVLWFLFKRRGWL